MTVPARILIVDDDTASLELLAYLLRAAGYDVLCAGGGREALALALRTTPDLILCDVRMGDMDGFALLAAVTRDAVLCAVPFVAVTASVTPGERIDMLGAGFDDVIDKPITARSFVTRIEGFLPAKLRAPRAARADEGGAGAARTPTGPTAITLLVVDDTATNLDLHRCCFEPLGYAVLTSGSAERALVRARGQRPDLILSDVQMLNGSGLGFLAAVRSDAQLKDVPFVFVSATHWDDAMRDCALKMGANRYLLRPIHPARLIAEVQSCMHEAQAAQSRSGSEVPQQT